MAHPIPLNPEPVVGLCDETVVLNGFIETDPTVVATVSEASDPELAVHRCLEVGARLTRGAQATLDADMVEKAFGALTDGFDATVRTALEEITGSTEHLVDEENGALPALLNGLKGDLAAQLDALFDADSKSSALARLEAVFSASATGLTKQMRAALDPSDEHSPLGQWKSEVMGTLQDSLALVLTQVAELRSVVAAGEAREATFKLTAIKGFSFEDQVHADVGALASRYGDLAEHVGATAGSAAAKTGDEVIELNTADTGGRRVAMVVEAKDKKVPMRKTLDELDRAMVNRDAAAGVVVFSSVANAPTAVPFSYFGNKGIAVIDPDDPADRVLEFAYLWLRWEARKILVAEASGIDVGRVEASMADARRALARCSTVRGCHTRAKKQIDLASGELDALVADVDTALGALRLELGE